MVTKDMTIGQIIKEKENAAQVLMSFGMGCVGCPSAQSETLEEASQVHGIDLQKLLDELNK